MTKFFQQTILAVALVFTFASLTNAQTQIAPADGEQPKVVKAVAPEKYPPAARATKAGGDILVEVKINSSGDVIAAKAISGNPLLKALSVQTARRWKFELVEKKSGTKSNSHIFLQNNR